ncbi:MAG: hypothetical protein JW888_01890 [Pirellulales bacterium]|nr:hypothetical protein [Pirellulales bacterium]
MSSTPCQVAAFTNVVEAEWARCRLGFEGIPAWLENAYVVLWFWHYSQAIGGVKVLVAPEQAQQARAILDQKGSADDGAITWPCSHCGELLPDDWATCWRCGTAREHAGDSDGPEFAASASESFSEQAPNLMSGFGVLAVIIVVVFGLVTYRITHDPFVSLASCLAALVAQAILAMIVGDAEEPGELLDDDDPGVEPEPVLSAVEQSQERRRQLGSFLAVRAWRAAMFSFVWFPLLLICSLATLLRIQPTRMLLGPFDRFRYYGTWALCIMVGILLVVPLWSRFSAVGMDFVDLVKYLWYTLTIDPFWLCP